MSFVFRYIVSGLLLLGMLQFAFPRNASADAEHRDVDPTQVLAYQGDVVLSQQEIDALFNKLPEADRLNFVRDGGKVDQLIRAVLRRKAIAADAAKAGYDQDPLIVTRMRLEAEKELADAWLQKLMVDAPVPDYETLAHEDYLANPDNYRSEELLDVSHILIGTAERSPKEAKALAESLESQLRADPSKFEEFVKQHSDDPAKANNGGRYRDMRHGMMVAPFEKAAFGLKEKGDLSDPVQTDYGYHIIRLNGRSGNELQEFSAVKDEAIARAKTRYLETYRENYLRKVLSDPILIPDGAVEIMAKRYFGENLELAPK